MSGRCTHGIPARRSRGRYIRIRNAGISVTTGKSLQAIKVNLANMGTKYLNPTEFKREVLMSMSDGVYELFPTRSTEEQSEDMKIAILNRNGY